MKVLSFGAPSRPPLGILTMSGSKMLQPLNTPVHPWMPPNFRTPSCFACERFTMPLLIALRLRKPPSATRCREQ
jgi:hypothetical protein